MTEVNWLHHPVFAWLFRISHIFPCWNVYYSSGQKVSMKVMRSSWYIVPILDLRLMEVTLSVPSGAEFMSRLLSLLNCYIVLF